MTALKQTQKADEFIAPVCKGIVDVLYQDDDILLINKPSGLLSLSGKNPCNKDSVHYRLVYGQHGVSPAFPSAKLIHRLDFGTSGIMVVGLNLKSTQRLNKQFQTRSIKKRYIAVLDGWLANDQGMINGAIAKDECIFPKVKICNLTGRVAVSEYVVLHRLSEPCRTLVQFTPHTGRTHQLRIHSQLVGHPIIGCDLYSNDKSQQMADRLLLHASDIFFEHPSSGEPFHGQCLCPFER